MVRRRTLLAGCVFPLAGCTNPLTTGGRYLDVEIVIPMDEDEPIHEVTETDLYEIGLVRDALEAAHEQRDEFLDQYSHEIDRAEADDDVDGWSRIVHMEDVEGMRGWWAFRRIEEAFEDLPPYEGGIARPGGRAVEYEGEAYVLHLDVEH